MKSYLKFIAALLAANLSLGIALGIDLFDAVPLPDDGFGSKANGFMDYAEDSCMIVGQKTDMFGRALPMAWDLDNDGQVTGSTQLPLPSGFQGGCSGADEFSNGDLVIIGNVTD